VCRLYLSPRLSSASSVCCYQSLLCYRSRPARGRDYRHHPDPRSPTARSRLLRPRPLPAAARQPRCGTATWHWPPNRSVQGRPGVCLGLRIILEFEMENCPLFHQRIEDCTAPPCRRVHVHLRLLTGSEVDIRSRERSWPSRCRWLLLPVLAPCSRHSVPGRPWVESSYSWWQVAAAACRPN
jgi:hypothetical protein